ncbi:hypothetical protein AVEN_115130-1 [Araneus ventricosus]|uniref:Uncharacterized protein n=1 Tax=Araneus ventricosus TaxID=182803 RepID=A0A4Y1ZYI9_ARAVE|nr:hypothetical protein AVEN_115130-1 [Araneus ventricosus]
MQEIYLILYNIVGHQPNTVDGAAIASDVRASSCPEHKTRWNSKQANRPRWPSLGFGAGGFHVRDPLPLKTRRVWGLVHVKSYIVVKRPPVGMAWKFGEGVPAQVSFSSSDRGSKLGGPSQNSPRVASKRDVNVTKTKTRSKRSHVTLRANEKRPQSKP